MYNIWYNNGIIVGIIFGIFGIIFGIILNNIWYLNEELDALEGRLEPTKESI